VVRLAGELKLTDLAIDVGRILEQSDNPTVVTACCHFFAAAPSRAILPLLLKIAESKSRLFVKGFPDDVRAAAVWAIGQIPGDEARQALERVRKESNTTIRLAANQAMKSREAPPGETARRSP
jgi:hypothetical protein